MNQNSASSGSLAGLDRVVPLAVMVGLPVTVLVNEQIIDPGSPAKISNLQSFTILR